MGRKRKIPKKIVVPTKPMVEEPPIIYDTIEAFLLVSSSIPMCPG